MPHGKISRLKLLQPPRQHSVEEGMEIGTEDLAAANDDQQLQGNAALCDGIMVKCCSPRTCRCPSILINRAYPKSAVKVVCNNEECTQSGWMHSECFDGKLLTTTAIVYLDLCSNREFSLQLGSLLRKF